MTHLELFAGIGGFRRALDLVGNDLHMPMECVGYSEIDNNASRTYRANFGENPDEVILGDIVAFTANDATIEGLPWFDLLTGGFPCQSFSMMGEQLGFADPTRGQMFYRILDILRVKHPTYILLENVKNLYTHDHGNTFAVIRQELENLGYHLRFDIFNTNDYHLAQKRNRVYIFGSLNPIPADFDFSHEAIAQHLNEIIDQTGLLNQESTLDVLQPTVDAKYFLSDRIKPTLLSDGSGGFKSKSDINQLQARPLTASMHKMHRACQDNYFSQNFIASHGADNPVTYATKEELSRLEIRKLTPQEAMMLQGFPAEWSQRAQAAGLSDGALYKQAGNAVSVNTVYAIIRYLIDNNIIQ